MGFFKNVKKNKLLKKLGNNHTSIREVLHSWWYRFFLYCIRLTLWRIATYFTSHQLKLIVELEWCQICFLSFFFMFKNPRHMTFGSCLAFYFSVLKKRFSAHRSDGNQLQRPITRNHVFHSIHIHNLHIILLVICWF